MLTIIIIPFYTLKPSIVFGTQQMPQCLLKEWMKGPVMGIAGWTESRQREKVVQWPWSWCCLLKRDSHVSAENWALKFFHGSWGLRGIHAWRKGNPTCPQRWMLGMGPRSFLEDGSESTLIEKHMSHWSPSPYFNSLENVSGEYDQQLTPAKSISIRFLLKAQFGAGSICCDDRGKLVFSKITNYMRQFTELADLFMNKLKAKQGDLPKIITVASEHLLCSLSFRQ